MAVVIKDALAETLQILRLRRNLRVNIVERRNVGIRISDTHNLWSTKIRSYRLQTPLAEA